MKTCAGCRFVMAREVQDGDTMRMVDFCRGAPPTPIVTVEQRGQNIVTTAVPYFPIVPQVRCGAFRRKWPWSRE